MTHVYFYCNIYSLMSMSIFITELIAILIGEAIGGLVFVLFLNPILSSKKTSSLVKDAIIDDDEYLQRIMGKLVYVSSLKMKFKDENGEVFEESPIKMIARLSAEEFQVRFKGFIGGKQSEMIREMENQAQTAISQNPENPYLALAMAQIPKKYLPYVQLLANVLINSQKS